MRSPEAAVVRTFDAYLEFGLRRNNLGLEGSILVHLSVSFSIVRLGRDTSEIVLLRRLLNVTDAATADHISKC